VLREKGGRTEGGKGGCACGWVRAGWPGACRAGDGQVNCERPCAHLAITLTVHIDANENIVVGPKRSGNGDALLCLGVEVSLGDVEGDTAGFARFWLAWRGKIGDVDL
jgi:hypothetical protein